MKQYINRIKFSPSKDPYITFKIADLKNILEEKGYKHYEISNFAKSGYESKHNLDSIINEIIGSLINGDEKENREEKKITNKRITNKNPFVSNR